MNLTDYFLAQSLHHASLAQEEITNPAHIDMMGKAMEILKQVATDRERIFKITGVRK
jgi:hypothetical protein